MNKEIEAKYKIASHDPIRKALVKLQAEPLGAFTQADAYFDNDADTFRTSDRALRLRRGTGEDGEKWAELTYKGPKEGTHAVKMRVEHQTRLADPDAMEQILLACGYEIRLRLEKHRESFRLGDCRVELDTLDEIGTWVEIEGPSEDAVVAVRDRLGIKADHDSRSYTTLVCQARGQEEK